MYRLQFKPSCLRFVIYENIGKKTMSQWTINSKGCVSTHYNDPQVYDENEFQNVLQ